MLHWEYCVIRYRTVLSRVDTSGSKSLESYLYLERFTRTGLVVEDIGAEKRLEVDAKTRGSMDTGAYHNFINTYIAEQRAKMIAELGDEGWEIIKHEVRDEEFRYMITRHLTLGTQIPEPVSEEEIWFRRAIKA